MTSATPSTLRSGVDVADVETAIREDWARLGAEAIEEDGPAPSRSRILNFIVISRAGDDASHARETIDSLAPLLLCRAMLIIYDPNATGMQAGGSARCSLVNGHQTGCYETIEIVTGPSGLAAMPSVIERLSVSDLPSFTWWASPVPIDSPDFRRISASSDRVTINSMSYPEPVEALARLAEYIRHSNSPAVSDLTWSRLLTLRELVAQSFDIDAAMEIISDIKRIEISYAADWFAPALLAAGWLTSRLGLEPTGAVRNREVTTLTALDQNANVVTVMLTTAGRTGPGVQSIRIQAHTAQQSSRVTVRRTDSKHATVSVDLTGHPRQQRVVTCLDCDDIELLGLDLMEFERDRIFEESLQHATGFAAWLDDERIGR